MLLRFVVSNFLSIGEEVELNLFPYTRLREHRDHIYSTPQIDLLKAAAIYGANGAGKSNLVKAMGYMRGVAVSSELITDLTPCTPFLLDDDLANKPSNFEIEFYTDGTYYAYGVSVRANIIVEEWLYKTYPKDGSDEKIFERTYHDGVTKTSFHPSYSEADKDRIRLDIYEREFITPVRSLIDLLAQNVAFTEIRAVHRWLQKEFQIVFTSTRSLYATAELLTVSEKFQAFVDLIAPKLDIGFERVHLFAAPFEVFFGQEEIDLRKDTLKQLASGAPYVKIPLKDFGSVIAERDGEDLIVKRLVFEHRGKGKTTKTLELYQQSEGTQRIVDLLPVLFGAIVEGHTVVIDEIGRSLHPELLRSIVRLFMRTEDTGQLIFTTHESLLFELDTFRKDELRLTQKSSTGATSIYPLSEFKPRHDLDIRKKYFSGRFGGIPNMGRVDRTKVAV